MFTAIDKALAALIMAALYLLNTFAGIDLGLSPDTINTIIAAITPFLVWLVPNKPVA
jgi:hypothetical protein